MSSRRVAPIFYNFGSTLPEIIGRSTHVKFLLCTVLFVLFVSPRVGFAQPPQLTRVSCAVSVTDVYGAPAAGIRVTVTITGQGPVTGQTDANGVVTVSTGRATTFESDVS